jgi:hypothetical protein
MNASETGSISGNATSGTETKDPDVFATCGIIFQLPPTTSANSGAIRAMGNPPGP